MAYNVVQLSYNEEFEVYSGYHQKGKNDFTQFKVYPDDTVKEMTVQGQFRDYEHFVGVFSKFNPYTFFWKKSVRVSKLNQKELAKHKDKIIKLKTKKTK